MKTVKLSHWKKGQKIACPDCGVKVKEPYECKEHGKFKVVMSFEKLYKNKKWRDINE